MINKKLCLTIIILLVFSVKLIAQNSPSDLIKEVCPDAEIIWEKEFEGNHQKFNIAKNTGDFIFNLRKSIKDENLNYIKVSKDGEIEFNEWINWATGIELSNKGEIIPIIYNKEHSKKILKKSIQTPFTYLRGMEFTPFLTFSANFDYYFIDQDENYLPLEIYKSDGQKIPLPDNIFAKGKKEARCVAKWIGNNELLVYILDYMIPGYRPSVENHRTFYLFSFPDMDIKWQYKVEKKYPPFYHSYFDRYLCDYSDKYIVIGSPNVKRDRDYILQLDRDNGFVREIPCRWVQYIKVLPELNLIFALSNYRHICLYDFDGNRIIRYKLNGWMMRRDGVYIVESDEGKKIIFTGIGHINEGDEHNIFKTDILTLNESFNVVDNKSRQGNIQKFYDKETKQTYFIAIDSQEQKCTLAGAKVSGKR